MKLKNKKSGEIGYLRSINWNETALIIMDKNGVKLAKYTSLTELNDEWEDYEENEYYFAITSIKADGGITKMKNKHNDMTAFDKSIGNYFETKEEAELAVRKLKAWKRLKDKGVRICKRSHGYYGGEMFWKCPNGTGISDKQIWKDLDLLFLGGEE